MGTPNSRLASERLMLALDRRLDENSISTLTPYGYKILDIIRLCQVYQSEDGALFDIPCSEIYNCTCKILLLKDYADCCNQQRTLSNSGIDLALFDCSGGTLGRPAAAIALDTPGPGADLCSGGQSGFGQPAGLCFNANSCRLSRGPLFSAKIGGNRCAGFDGPLHTPGFHPAILADSGNSVLLGLFHALSCLRPRCPSLSAGFPRSAILLPPPCLW